MLRLHCVPLSMTGAEGGAETGAYAYRFRVLSTVKIYFKKIFFGKTEISQCIFYDELRYRGYVSLQNNRSCQILAHPFLMSALCGDFPTTYFIKKFPEIIQWDIT